MHTRLHSHAGCSQGPCWMTPKMLHKSRGPINCVLPTLHMESNSSMGHILYMGHWGELWLFLFSNDFSLTVLISSTSPQSFSFQLFSALLFLPLSLSVSFQQTHTNSRPYRSAPHWWSVTLLRCSNESLLYCCFSFRTDTGCRGQC